MITFYYNLAPNPMKVALLLEELGTPYEPVPLDTRRGEQHAPAFRAVNPNGKAPAIVDDGVPVFDSNAILLYLAEKHGRFLGAPGDQAALFSWLMFVATGVGPYSGQAVHFRHFAPEPKDYPVKRYMFEANRHWSIANDRLADREWLTGDAYGIADMALWGWSRMAPFILGDDAYKRLPHIKRHWDAISARPAAQRVEALRGRHQFKTETDEEARLNLFPFLAA